MLIFKLEKEENKIILYKKPILFKIIPVDSFKFEARFLTEKDCLHYINTYYEGRNVKIIFNYK